MPARAAVLLLCCLALPLFADTFYVTGDYWTPRSLNWAIDQANDKAGRDQVRFDIVGDYNEPPYPYFEPGLPQPPITEAIDIDGSGAGYLYRDSGPETPPFLTFSAGSSTSTLQSFSFPTLRVDPGVTGLVLRVNDIYDVTLSGSGHSVHANYLRGVDVLNASNITFTRNHIGPFLVVDSPGTIVEDNVIGTVNFIGSYHGEMRIATDDLVVRNNSFNIPVTVLSTGVSLAGNRISNDALPIDLGGDGPTPNDPAPDADTGPNGLQNYPVLISATPVDGAVVVTGTLTSAPLTPYQIELFISTEGVEPRTLGDSFAASTDAAGELTFTRSITPLKRTSNFTTPLTHPGQVIVATATNRALVATPGNHPNSTSEASSPLPLHLPGKFAFRNAANTAFEQNGVVQIMVTRTGGSDGTVTVGYATSNGSATAPADYVATSGTLTFGPGVVEQTFSIPIVLDFSSEPDETFTVTLNDTTGGATVLNGTATVTIRNAVLPGRLGFENATYTANENDGTVTIKVTRTGGSHNTVTVDFATSNGSAAAPADYTATSGTLTFGPGVTEQSFTVPIIQDMIPESDEAFTVALSNALGGATVLFRRAIVTIAASATPGGFAFENATYTADENDGTITIMVTRTGGDEGAVTVDYATTDGSATAPADYTQTSGTLTFGPGVTEQTFTVAIVQDMVPESNESFIITLRDPTGGATIVNGTTTVTITGSAIGAATVPTASEWGLMVLALGLALFAARAMRHF